MTALPRRLKRALDHALKAMPPNGDLKQMTDAIAQSRGRPIVVLDEPMPRPGPTGFWLKAAHRDYIVIGAGMSPAHRAATLCHELAHMLLGHEGHPDRTLSTLVAPNLAPAVSGRFLTRNGYTDDQELAAETLGTLIVTEHLRRVRNPRWSPDILTARLR
ncbi:MAG: ImmA/IrrE family metallo-endopeptidase [Nocardioides sp.]